MKAGEIVNSSSEEKYTSIPNIISKTVKSITLILIRMSKCQKNKYAAGGRCGTMDSCSGDKQKNPEVNANLAALIASREKQDALLFSATPVNSTHRSAIVSKKMFSKSDIDTVLEGDF